MAKATKKSKNTPPDVEPSTSSAKSKKAKTYHQPTTSCSQCCGKVQKMKKKAQKTQPRIYKKKASKKTVPPTKKTKRAKGEAPLRHYHRSMDEMTPSTETEPEQSSSDSSTESSSDDESQ